METADEIPCLIQMVFKDVPIKAVAHNSAIPAIPAKQSVQKLQKSRTAGKNFSLAWQISAIPAKAGIQYNKCALRAPFKGGAVRQSLQCARTALDLHWIPAFAGMAGWGRGNGGVGLYSLDARRVFTQPGKQKSSIRVPEAVRYRQSAPPQKTGFLLSQEWRGENAYRDMF